MSQSMYFEADVNPAELEGKVVAMLGYGSQGQSQSLNLRDSGVQTVVGLRPDGPSWRLAQSDGWEPLSIGEAVAQADLVAMMIPDMIQPRVYREEVLPNLQEGAALSFAHGFCIHYQAIQPDPRHDVILVAPKGQGRMVRQQYLEGHGVPALIAVAHDASGRAHDLALAYAWAMGSARAGILETTFAEETETDLFGEQTVLCGGLTELITAGWQTLVDAGYQPEVAYFECLHEVKLVVDLIYQSGLNGMHDVISATAAYGDVTVGPRIINQQTRETMRQVLKEIQDGSFAKAWLAEAESGMAEFKRLVQRDREHPIEAVGKRVRSQFAWTKPAKADPSAATQAGDGQTGG